MQGGGLECPGPAEEEEAGAGACRLAREHHDRGGQAFLENSIEAVREGKHQVVVSPAVGGDAYVGLLELKGAGWSECAVGSAVLDSCPTNTSRAEVRRKAEDAAVLAGGPVVLAIKFAAAVGDGWPRARLVEKLASPGRTGLGSPSYSCILMGSGRSGLGQGQRPMPVTKAPAVVGGEAWMRRLDEGDAGLHNHVVRAAMTACPTVSDDVRRICRVRTR